VEPFDTADRSLPDRKPVRRQLAKARPEVRVYIPLQHLGGRVDVRIGIINAKPVLHSALLVRHLQVNPDDRFAGIDCRELFDFRLKL
jgi:hypothetical protein